MGAPTVSIIINNYNYGRFLRDAIESAFAQSYPHVQVIVVDDGSTDDSRERLAPYANRATLVFKENGGQASAFNAGLARSQGDIIIFLDSDDALTPTISQRVAACFEQAPDAAKVQYRLIQIDEAGKPTGALVPPTGQQPARGDLRAQVLRHPDDLTWLPTSGNAFAAHVLRDIFPVPEADYRLCADYYLSNLTPLFGPVIALEEPGGYYRVHGANGHHRARLQIDQSRQTIQRSSQTHHYLRQYAARLGLKAADIRSVTYTAHRLISLRAEPDLHPFAGDNRFDLLREGMRAARTRTDVPPARRIAYGLWFLVAALAPRRWVPRLAELFFYPESRPFYRGGSPSIPAMTKRQYARES